MSKRQQVLKMIAEAVKADGVELGKDPHTLSVSQSNDLYEWSQAVRYKASGSSSLSPGRQFYAYLSKLFAK